MPAVGDLRSRLMALADETELGHPEIVALFSHRLSAESAREAGEEFAGIETGGHRLMRAVSQPMRRLILQQLTSFIASPTSNTPP